MKDDMIALLIDQICDSCVSKSLNQVKKIIF